MVTAEKWPEGIVLKGRNEMLAKFKVGTRVRVKVSSSEGSNMFASGFRKGTKGIIILCNALFYFPYKVQKADGRYFYFGANQLELVKEKRLERR